MYYIFFREARENFLFCRLGRVLCLSWHENDVTLVTGASDSTVRVYNVMSGMKIIMSGTLYENDYQ